MTTEEVVISRTSSRERDLGRTLIFPDDLEKSFARCESGEVLSLLLERLGAREVAGASRSLEVRGELGVGVLVVSVLVPALLGTFALPLRSRSCIDNISEETQIRRQPRLALRLGGQLLDSRKVPQRRSSELCDLRGSLEDESQSAK